MLNPTFVRKEWIISWNNHSQLTTGENVTNKTVLELGENKQYSFQLYDGSLLQIYYEFHAGGNRLENASLAFYKFESGRVQFSEDTEECTEDEMCSDSFIDDEFLVPWVRFDCHPEHSRGVVHSAIHMHSNINPSVRIPVSGVPTPKQFVEVIIAWFYPVEYSSRYLNDIGDYLHRERISEINRHTIPCLKDPNVNKVVYLDMPKA